MKRSKNIFFTSDWHVGHENSIKFDNRPFKNIDDMHRVLINNYNSSIGPNDVCYFLGDISVKNSEVTREVVSQLNGTKVLILGNHDLGIQANYDCGFDVVINSCSMVIAGELVTMSHCPLPGILREDTEGMRGAVKGEHWHGEFRHKNFTVANNNQYHLHGHIHSPNGGKSIKILDKQYDVGCVANNFRPVSISQIESWITLYKKQNDSI